MSLIRIVWLQSLQDCKTSSLGLLMGVASQLKGPDATQWPGRIETSYSGFRAIQKIATTQVSSGSHPGVISMTRKELAEMLSQLAEGQEICVPYDVFKPWWPLAKSARLFLFHGCSVRNDRDAQQICFRKRSRRPGMTFRWMKWRLKPRR
jgi:hypothetical protein